MNKLKVGIAGFGIVGKRRKNVVDVHPGMETVAVCDRNFDSDGVFADGVRYYQSHVDLLRDDLDILIVCLTNEIAPVVTMSGLSKGLHVFCEKPPGRNVEDIQNVIKVHESVSNLKLMYGFNHRYHDSVKEALSIVRSGNLGKIINLRGVYGKSKLITFNQTEWRTKREIAGGGVLLDQGIHMVDLMRLFAGEFCDVQSYISNQHWGYDVEDNAYAIMRTTDGVVGMINSSATQWRHRFNLDIGLEFGSVILGGILSGTKSYGAETLTVVRVDHSNDYGDPKEQMTKYNQDNSWSEELDLFFDSIVSDTEIQSGNAQDALETMKLVFRIYYADPAWRTKYNIENPDS